MIKMVVSSFYNTLIDSEDAIPTSTMLEIERLRNKKILFTVATNGLYEEVLDYNKDFNFVDYIVSLNGSYIYDVSKQKCIFKKKISPTMIKKILSIYSEDIITYYSDKTSYNEYDESKETYKVEIELTDNDEDKLSKIKKLKLNYSILYHNNKKYLEITNSNASIFNGIDQISLKNNFDLKDIITICGNDSDTAVVQNIKNSYVVENADKNLKSISKNITLSNNNKGVERVLQKVK